MIAATSLAIPCFFSIAARAQQRLDSAGWLELEELTGQVTIKPSRAPEFNGAPGKRLAHQGDAVETGVSSTAVFRLDRGIGQLFLAEETRFRIETLELTPQGGRVTQIRVERGQVHLSLRPFLNPASRFVVLSPTGQVKVKGTEFGVTVQPDGKTGVATEAGQVEVSAEGEMVEVKTQQQTIIIPGEPPKPVRPLVNLADLMLELAELSEEELHLVGNIEPINLLTIDGVNQTTGEAGEFDITLPIQGKDMVLLQVTTPLGSRRTYRIPLFHPSPDRELIPTKAVD